MSATWEVQKVLVAQLEADSTFMNLITGIHDEPPTNAQYPYVTCGDVVETSDNTLSYRGYDTSVTFMIHTKPAGLGTYTAKQILEAMNDVLNMKKFDMTGFDMIICKFDNAITDRDGDKRNILARYQVLSDTNTLITF